MEVRRTIAQYLTARRLASDAEESAVFYDQVAAHLPALRLHVETADAGRQWVTRLPLSVFANMKLNDEVGDASSKCMAPLLSKVSRRGAAPLALALVFGVFNHRMKKTPFDIALIFT